MNKSKSQLLSESIEFLNYAKISAYKRRGASTADLIDCAMVRLKELEEERKPIIQKLKEIARLKL